MLRLSGEVINWTFTLGDVDVRAYLFVDHRCINVFICVLNFRSWSQPRNYFNSNIFKVYGILGPYLLNHFGTWWSIQSFIHVPSCIFRYAVAIVLTWPYSGRYYCIYDVWTVGKKTRLLNSWLQTLNITLQQGTFLDKTFFVHIQSGAKHGFTELFIMDNKTHLTVNYTIWEALKPLAWMTSKLYKCQKCCVGSYVVRM